MTRPNRNTTALTSRQPSLSRPANNENGSSSMGSRRGSRTLNNNSLPKSDRRTEGDIVNDSDDSSLSTTLTLDEPLLAEDKKQPQANRLSSQEKRQAPSMAELPPEEAIIATALIIPLSERTKRLPQCFGSQGRLFKKFSYLIPKIEEAKDERKAQDMINRQLQPPEVTQSETSQQPKVSQTADTQFLAHKGQPQSYMQESRLASVRHRTGDWPSYAVDENSAPATHPSYHRRGEPTVVGGVVQNTSNHGSIREGNHELSPRSGNKRYKKGTQQPKANTKPPRRVRRFPQPTNPDDSRISSAGHNSTPQVIILGGKVARIEESALPQERKSTLPKEKQRTPLPEGIIITTPLFQIDEQLPPPDNSQISSGISHHARVAAFKTVHHKIEEQHARNAKVCDRCQQNLCCCKQAGLSPPAPDEILCSDENCEKRWYSKEYLMHFIGTELRDAQEYQRKRGFWFCPQCAHKAQVMPKSQEQNTLSRLEHGYLEVGEWLGDDEIREPLDRFTGLLKQYSSMVRKKLALLHPQMRFLDLPCVRDERCGSPADGSPAVTYILRELLDVPQQGFVIKEKIDILNIQETDCTIWIRSVLSFVFCDFIFHWGSPFEDDAILRRSLTYGKPLGCFQLVVSSLANFSEAGNSPQTAEQIIQSTRIQAMEALRNPKVTPQPKELLKRVTKRQEAFVEQLNITMKPILGGDSDLEKRHRVIAGLATDLNLKISAYSGEFKEIAPKLNENEKFDPNFHTPDNPELEDQDLSGQPILVTTMMGIKFRLPGRPWRTCSKARVQLVPCSTNIPSSMVMPDGIGGRFNTTNQSLVPKKRYFKDLPGA
jgi:hypothetical protein